MDDGKLDRLMAALRQRRIDTTRAEMGFEARTMAAIRAGRSQETPVFFMAWKLAPMFLVLLLAVAGWVYAVAGPEGDDHLAAIGAGHEEIQMVRYITGN